jgi:hypothetical protein
MPKNPVTEPLNLSRDQILTRLWELANLSPEATRGIIAGQVKALAMIVAIEGLIPGRLSPAQPAKAAPPAPAPRPPFVHPLGASPVPDAACLNFATVLAPVGPLKLPGR